MTKKNTKKETKKSTKKAENKKVEAPSTEITLKAEKAKRTETSDKTWFSNAQQQAIATCQHKFSGEKITIVRPQRRDTEPFSQAIIVHYPNGSYGCLCMFTESREKWARAQLAKLEARQIAEKPGFGHDFGSIATVEAVKLAVKEMIPTKSRKVGQVTEQQAEKTKKTAKSKKAPKTFSSRKSAREYAQSIGVAQSAAKKSENGWIVEKTN